MANSRSRSAGVTAAATYAILCSATAFLFWGYVFIAILNSPPDESGHHVYQRFPVTFFLIAFVPPAVVALGIRTAVGLLQLRPWARRASMLWAAIALALCLAIIGFRPFETFIIPQKFVSQVVLTKQMLAIAFVLMLFPVSIWWLYYFRTTRVKLQFLSDPSAPAQNPSPVQQI
jgi:hypothetical protein